MVLTEQAIDQATAYFKRYVSRAEQFLARLEEETKCEICYERPRSCGYTCERHRVCKECHVKLVLCPFCRAPQLGAHPDLWYFTGLCFEWAPLTEAVICNGIRGNRNSERFSSPAHFAYWMDSACEAGITQLQAFQDSPASFKMVLRCVADCINRRANYPIFAWHKQQHLQFCAKRWRRIKDAIVVRTQANANTYAETELRLQLQESMNRLLRKIKEVAGKAGLRLSPSPS